ncbi:MAG: DNA replication/repair protein RecF [Pseudomonadota bacterium]
MILDELRIQQFRLIQAATLTFEHATSAVIGANGAGKTSVLEAAYFLSRTRSFRQSRSDRLIQHGTSKLTLFGRTTTQNRSHRLGVSVTQGSGTEIHLDGGRVDSAAEIAGILPVQVLEPELHRLISEGPELRRRFIDYGVFHVEPTFLDSWRRYRQALKQRNAALRMHQGPAALKAFEPALIEAGGVVDGLRMGYVNLLAPHIREEAAALGLNDIDVSYRPGWQGSTNFAEALEAAAARDAHNGTTTVGPHRADLRIRWRGRAAREQVSRGQQKLLAASLVLAQSRLLASVNQTGILLLVDDPAAELDSRSLEALMARVLTVPGQRIITAIDASRSGLPDDCPQFSITEGVLS